MNNVTLSASLFQFSSNFFDRELESVLCECINIYHLIVSKHTMFKNNEETIRDGFMCYLKDDNYKNTHFPLDKYQFDKEVEDGQGRLDIRILNVNPYKGDKAFYCIECKRLGTDKALNTEYIKNGICRFVNNDYYSSFFGCNAMFGFLINRVCVQTDIIDNINSKLDKKYNIQGKIVCANAIQKLQYSNFTGGYAYSYMSTHKGSSKEITLYHLMFDFSNNIVP